jgi:hypothetical protein
MTDTRLPLPEAFQWMRWNSRHIIHWKPGDPSPDAVIYELKFESQVIAKIERFANDQWLVTVGACWDPKHHKHAVAGKESVARYWCEKWAQREEGFLRKRYPLGDRCYGARRDKV